MGSRLRRGRGGDPMETLWRPHSCCGSTYTSRGQSTGKARRLNGKLGCGCVRRTIRGDGSRCSFRSRRADLVFFPVRIFRHVSTATMMQSRRGNRRGSRQSRRQRLPWKLVSRPRWYKASPKTARCSVASGFFGGTTGSRKRGWD